MASKNQLYARISQLHGEVVGLKFNLEQSSERLREYIDRLDTATEGLERADMLIDGPIIYGVETMDGDIEFGGVLPSGLLGYFEEAESGKAFEARKAASLAKAQSRLEITPWALLSSFTVTIDGLIWTITPNTSGRRVETISEMGVDGELGKTVTKTTGRATVTTTLPFLGSYSCEGELVNTATKETPTDEFSEYENTLTFIVEMGGGFKKQVEIKAAGFVVGFSEHWFGVTSGCVATRTEWCPHTHRMFHTYDGVTMPATITVV